LITADGNDDQYAVTDEDIYTEAKEFLKSVIDAESANRSKAMEALNFKQGGAGQWNPDLYRDREADGRLSITMNLTGYLVTRVENSLKQQRPRIKCHPSGEGADIEKADLVNGLVRDIENKSQASVAYDYGAGSALDIGWGYWRVVGQYVSERGFEQELRIKPIRNTFTVYKDPGSVLPDGSDSMRYVISEKMKRTRYKMEHPKASNAEFEAMGLAEGDLEWESKDEIRLAEYYRIVEKPERLFKMVDGKTMFESEFAPGVLKQALQDPDKHGFFTQNGKALERKSFRRQVEWYRINGREVVEKRELPGQYIPVILCTGNVADLNGKVVRKGMVEDMMDPARLVNYWESSKAERLALTSKAPWKAYEGVTDGHPEWGDANQKNYGVLVGKAIPGPGGQLLPLPERQEPAPVEQGFTEASQDSKSMLLAIAGNPHEPGQDAKGEVVSGVALQKRRDIADDTHYQYYDNQTLSIAFTGRILFDLIPYYYDTEREQRIIGEDGVPKVVWINQTVQDEQGTSKKNDLTIGRYDVVMDTGPGYDTKRQEGAEALTALLDTPMGEVITHAAPDIVMRSYDFPYAEEIANRLMTQSPEGMEKAMEELPKQAQAIVKSLQQKMQAMQGELQQAQMELKYKTSIETGWMHVEREKAHLKAETDTRDTHTNAHTKVFDTEVRAHTARDVAEIQAGAQLLNTHAEAAHEKEAAKEMLKHAETAEKPN
jgi:portal protein